MSQPAELLPEPFALLTGPAAPHVRLGAGAQDFDEPDRSDVEPDAEAVPELHEEPSTELQAEPNAEPAPAAAAAASSALTRPAGRVVTGRGVTGRGVVVLILVITGVVGLVELAIAGHRGHAFGVAFVVSSTIGALVVRRRDLPTALIAPPLLYCVLIFAMSVVDRHDDAGGLLTREGVYVGNAFVTGAPALWAGTAAAALVAWYRRRSTRLK